MALEVIKLNEVISVPKDTSCMIFLIHRSQLCSYTCIYMEIITERDHKTKMWAMRW